MDASRKLNEVVMCQFCDDLSFRSFRIPMRNSSAYDNRCEFGSPDVIWNGVAYGSKCDDCDGCSDENLYFDLHTCNNRIGFGFYNKIKKLVIAPNSEMLDINFCPWCGRKLSDEMVEFSKCCCGIDLERV